MVLIGAYQTIVAFVTLTFRVVYCCILTGLSCVFDSWYQKQWVSLSTEHQETNQNCLACLI
jgi:hypothetical protein